MEVPLLERRNFSDLECSVAVALPTVKPCGEAIT
jgi:hypothetical protein